MQKESDGNNSNVQKPNEKKMKLGSWINDKRGALKGKPRDPMKFRIPYEPIDLLRQLCSVKPEGSWRDNPTDRMPRRVQWILDMCEDLGFETTVDKWHIASSPLYNVHVHGKGPLMLIAHHDINNPDSENANDNSASIVNALMLKTLRPSTPLTFTDGEEFGGFGAKRLGTHILNKSVPGAPYVRAVLNLELTGRGGKYFFLGESPMEESSDLSCFIQDMFECPTFPVPFNDAVILRNMGIDTVVINPLPPLTEKEKSWEVGYSDSFPIEYLGESLNKRVLHLCHSKEDTVSKCSNRDMREFIGAVLDPIVRKYF